jgi:hypothetical protein
MSTVQDTDTLKPITLALHTPYISIKNIWKLCFGAILHSTYMIGSGVSEDEQLYGGLPNDDASCIATCWSS